MGRQIQNNSIRQRVYEYMSERNTHGNSRTLTVRQIAIALQLDRQAVAVCISQGVKDGKYVLDGSFASEGIYHIRAGQVPTQTTARRLTKSGVVAPAPYHRGSRWHSEMLQA